MNKRFSFTRRSKWLAIAVSVVTLFALAGVALAAAIQIDTFGGINNEIALQVRSALQFASGSADDGTALAETEK